MVGSRKRTMPMKARVTKGKENILSTEKINNKEDIYIRKLDRSLSILRRKIKFRVDRCQEILEKIDNDSRDIKICFLQLMNMVDNSRKLIKEEQEENVQILHLLDGFYSGKIRLSSRTQAVNPMIAGLPIKKASISLRRLDPFQELLSHGNPREPASGPPASLPQPVPTPVVHENIQVLNQEVDSPPSVEQEVASSLQSVLSRYRRRFRRRHEASTADYPMSLPDVHLKRASIQLKRLDPRPYLHEGGSIVLNNSQNMPFQVPGTGNSVFESVYPARSLITPIESEGAGIIQSVCAAHGQNFIATSTPQPRPMVVLKRLGTCSSSGSCELSNSLSMAHNMPSPVFTVPGSCGSHYEMVHVCGESGRNNSVFQNGNTEGNHISAVGGSLLRSSYARNARKDQDTLCPTSKERCRRTVVEKRIASSVNARSGSKRKKSNNTNKNTVEVQQNGTMKCAEKGMDDDPLEGPSWLYKDGVLKPAKLKKLKKIREDYLTPFYQFGPTIYPSSDESGEEVNVKEKKVKLRKKKQRRKY